MNIREAKLFFSKFTNELSMKNILSIFSLLISREFYFLGEAWAEKPLRVALA